MDDTSTSPTAEPEAKPEPATNPSREPIPRHVYVAMRLEEISANLGEMVKEREKLTSDLSAPPGAEGPNHRQLRLRRGYVALRIAIIRKEQAQLNAEMKTLAGAQRKGIVGKKKVPKAMKRKSSLN
jgi:hypothetical protein